MNLALRFTLLALPLLVACEPPPAASRRNEPAPAKGRPLGTGGRAPGPAVVSRVRWPAAEGVDRSALARLGADAAQAVRASPVPVLLPPAADLSRAVVVARGDWYSVSIPGEERTIFVSGSRVALPAPRDVAARAGTIVRGQRASITQNEGIHSAAWSENGASYVLEIECAEVRSRHCTEAALLELAEALTFVGGAGIR